MMRERLSKRRERKIYPTEIRKMLIVKLPQLKSNIMMLDDAQMKLSSMRELKAESQATVPQSGVSQANQPKPVEQPPKMAIRST